MNDMKYISFHGALHTEIVLFPNTNDHSVFADRLGIRKDDIIGAGFIVVDQHSEKHIWCYGKSRSLGVSSHEGDDELLHRFLNIIRD